MDESVNIIWYDENLSDTTKDILDTIHYRVFLCRNTEKILLVLFIGGGAIRPGLAKAYPRLAEGRLG